MMFGRKERSKTSTMGNDNKEIHLPEEIKKALLDGYDVHITRSMREGVLSAKITFHKVKLAGTDRLDKNAGNS